MTDTIEYRRVGADAGAEAAFGQLRTLLVAGETVVAGALQHRLYALIHRRDLAAATTGRFIYIRRRLLGGYDPVSLRWQDLKSAELTVGMFTARVTLTFNANLSDTASGEGETRVLRAGGLRIEPAQALYRECQAQDQAWREKRRVRAIEEMRARAGGVRIAPGPYGQGEIPAPNGPAIAAPRAQDGPSQEGTFQEGPVRRLSRAREMLLEGLITDAEFEAIKARIVGSL